MKLKGVIVAAGYGSRFLPVTKTIAKEMLPLIDRPAIAFIVEEFLASGIEDLLIITSRRKKSLDDYFDRDPELEAVLREEGKEERLCAIAPPAANVHFIRQQEMKGTGHALLLCRTFVGDDPFVVAYPDDIVFADVPLSLQLAEVHRRTGGSVLAVKNLAGEDVSRYGVIDSDGIANPFPVKRLVEKPPRGQEPSHLVSYGRYLFTPDIFPLLEAGWRDHHHGEYYHVAAINALAAAGKVAALDFEGRRFDLGQPQGYLEALCHYALMRADLAEEARKLFEELARS